MMALSERIISEVRNRPGITDRWLAEALFGPGTPQQRINGECRHLASIGKILRQKREDGLIGNFVIDGGTLSAAPVKSGLVDAAGDSSEDRCKRALEAWLTSQGWSARVAWGRSPGVDIDARRASDRWLIEVKGEGSLNAMRVNYFLSMLGELLQRMDDPKARYSIAVPDLKQFRNLWLRVPKLAKERTTISALFVCADGSIEEIK